MSPHILKWAFTIIVCAISLIFYTTDIKNAPQTKIVSHSILQDIAPPKTSLAAVMQTSPEISSVSFLGVVFSADNPKDATALLKVGTGVSQPFQAGDVISNTLKLREIHPEKVVISTVNGYPDFDVVLRDNIKDILQESGRVVSSTVSNVSTENQALPGLVKNGGLNRPQDEKAIAANNAAFLSAVQNMKQN